MDISSLNVLSFFFNQNPLIIPWENYEMLKYRIDLQEQNRTSWVKSLKSHEEDKTQTFRSVRLHCLVVSLFWMCRGCWSCEGVFREPIWGRWVTLSVSRTDSQLRQCGSRQAAGWQGGRAAGQWQGRLTGSKGQEEAWDRSHNSRLVTQKHNPPLPAPCVKQECSKTKK